MVDDCDVTYNKVNGSGGFIMFNALGPRTATIKNSRIRNNSANFGGAIWAVNVNITISNTFIEDNHCAQNGGGINLSLEPNGSYSTTNMLIRL